MEWVVTDNVEKETWSRLLEYANSDVAIQAISKFHGKADSSSTRSNYKKQAQQIRSCILQAKEYFSAASHSSLITSLNHSYYGMISLASSFMLLRGDGSHSLDVLRRNPQNKNHGLDFSTGITKELSNQSLSILERSNVKISPAGHFSVWYETLPPQILLYGPVSHFNSSNSTVHTDFGVVGMSRRISHSELIGKRYSLLDCLMNLPDLFGELRRFGVAQSSSRFNHEMHITEDGGRRNIWYIHSATSAEALEEILNNFAFPGAISQNFSVRTSRGIFGAVVECTLAEKDFTMFQFPGSRLSLSVDNICYANDIRTHEFVDMYLASFSLSMLSRYFPDLWVTCLESNCLAEKLIERFSSILIRKAPMLALSLLSDRDCFISTHRIPGR